MMTERCSDKSFPLGYAYVLSNEDNQGEIIGSRREAINNFCPKVGLGWGVGELIVRCEMPRQTIDAV